MKDIVQFSGLDIKSSMKLSAIRTLMMIVGLVMVFTTDAGTPAKDVANILFYGSFVFSLVLFVLKMPRVKIIAKPGDVVRCGAISYKVENVSKQGDISLKEEIGSRVLSYNPKQNKNDLLRLFHYKIVS